MARARVEERFKTLRYFIDGYYNQSIDDEFDGRIRDFRDYEPKCLVNALRRELVDLRTVVAQADKETFKKVEVFLHDNRLRYIEFEDGEAFIKRVLRILDETSF
ncbi:contact-dependent growth inhibition system immunity protein [Geobacillus stearothermophilus]|uniref:contact-dependent growth inhibition system immunity protein n=1 Tax=Geobacillus stearothermophilus TaxID=1422 RepID=UPI002402D78D|nr:contact-dependent growth inhibition system immunity protein [Geobacillus stearothermophilus]MDF9298444.1 contact-dependent growth inhibition system immunity protein [Geobacillus stearothermophilus]